MLDHLWVFGLVLADGMLDQERLLRMLLAAPPILLSLTVHEYAHARTALAFGDPTALYNGRVTLNPLAHLDPIGTICMFFAYFGWAKPVPVDVSNLHPRGLGNFAVSLAGPGSNLCMAIISGVALRLIMGHFITTGMPESEIAQAALTMLEIMVICNVSLFVFNLIPLHPLDGSHILQEMLPLHLHHRYIFWQMHYGMYVLAAVILLPRLLSDTSLGFLDPIGFIQSMAMKVLFHTMWG